jgi:hypothetical protein
MALAIYMQVVTWIPLGRWNYQPCCPTGLELLRRGTLTVTDVFSTAAFLLPLAAFWLGTHWRLRWVTWLALVAVAIWLVLQLATWWPPYLFGASDRWSRVYERAFAHSTAILPRWDNHLPPDAMHFVLQVLLAGNLLTGIAAALRQHDNPV